MNGTRDLALWAALVAFFANLIAFKAVGLLAGGDVRLGLSALLTSGAVAGFVYAKTRRDAAAKRVAPPRG